MFLLRFCMYEFEWGRAQLENRNVGEWTWKCHVYESLNCFGSFIPQDQLFLHNNLSPNEQLSSVFWAISWLFHNSQVGLRAIAHNFRADRQYKAESLPAVSKSREGRFQNPIQIGKGQKGFPKKRNRGKVVNSHFEFESNFWPAPACILQNVRLFDLAARELNW